MSLKNLCVFNCCQLYVNQLPRELDFIAQKEQFFVSEEENQRSLFRFEMAKVINLSQMDSIPLQKTLKDDLMYLSYFLIFYWINNLPLY